MYLADIQRFYISLLLITPINVESDLDCLAGQVRMYASSLNTAGMLMMQIRW